MNLSRTLRFMFVISKFYCCRVKTGSLRDVFQGHSGLGFRVPHPHPPLLSVHRVPHRTEPSRFIYIFFFSFLPRALIILFSSFLPLRFPLGLYDFGRKIEKMKGAASKALLLSRRCSQTFQEFVNISPTRSLSFCLIISIYLSVYLSLCLCVCLRKRKCAREPESER